jgi:hypothetical protein
MNLIKRSKSRQNLIYRAISGTHLALLLLLLSLLGASCQASVPEISNSTGITEPKTGTQQSGENNRETSQSVPEGVDQSGASHLTDPDAIRVAWQENPHADTYVLTEQGTNSACARCHSPVNWIPSMEDMPESCYSCKFTIEPPPPLIEEQNWEHIQCNVCHKVKKDEVAPEYAWLEIPPIEEYAQVSSSSELCLKCHSGAQLPGHPAVEVAGAHADMLCTDCHDAHTAAASCGPAGCHTALDEQPGPIPGHDSDHQAVSCAACHDAGNLIVQPDEEGYWVTFLPGEQEAAIAFTSHNTVLEAPCERCHFRGNPWGLKETLEP